MILHKERICKYTYKILRTTECGYLACLPESFTKCSLIFLIPQGASFAERLESLTYNNLPLTAVGSNPAKNFGFFFVRKLSSYLTERPWFYTDTHSCLKAAYQCR